MAARNFLWLNQETSFGTPIASPVNGTSAFYIRESQSNAYTPLMKPVIGQIAGGNGLSTTVCFYSDGYVFTGTLQGELYASISKFLTGWACTPVNTGRTTPWTTTDANFVMPPGDLASVSAYRAVLENSGTYKRRRGSGLKVGTATYTASRQDPVWKYNYNLTGIRDDTNAAGTVADPDATEFPAPTDSLYSCDPFLFSHTAGGLKIGSSRTLFDSISITVTNTLTASAWEARYPQTIAFSGRKVEIQVGLYRKPSPDDLASFRALTALDVEVTLFNGTNTLKFDFNTNNRWTDMTEDVPLDGPLKWTGTITNAYDTSVGSDFTVAYT